MDPTSMANALLRRPGPNTQPNQQMHRVQELTPHQILQQYMQQMQGQQQSPQGAFSMPWPLNPSFGIR